MENDYKKLPILKPLLAFVTLIVILTILFFAASSFSAQRKQQVYNDYARETQDYIAKNRQGLKVLFNDVFIPCPAPIYSSSCTSPKAKEIPGLVSSDLKDWSSTIFIKLVNEHIHYMGLSGEINTYYSSFENQQILLGKLLRGEVEEIPWENYSYQLPNKEVIIPVKDESGRVIGAIMRGVIEEKSF